MGDTPDLEGLPTHLRLDGPIGSGGTATVWRARDTRRGRDVALKLLDVAPGAGEQLEHEVRALARLNDLPGVATLYECGVTGAGTAWLAGELVPGGSLADRLRAGSLDPDEVLRMAAALATTLAAAHGRGVVHGDLTPSNVLFDSDGTPKLVDLGLACIDGLGTHGCTPAYAAPERLRGAPASAASDLWSLAALVDAATDGELPRGRVALDACRDERPSRRPSAAEVARELGPTARRRWGRR